MKLPNAERAFIDAEKLRSYCLSTEHPRGRNKARIFAALLGLTADQSEHLRQIILQSILATEARIGEADAFGQRYTVDFSVAGPSKNVTIRTAWILRIREDFPRLTSCYIL